MRRFAAQYRDFFRLPDVAGLMIVAVLARMHIGMVGLAMLMFLRELLGSYALAGSVSGVYFVAMAVGAPIQGRLIDRSGPKLALSVTGLVQPLALMAILALARAQAGFGAVVVAAAMAGLFAVPITVLTRTLWRQRFTREEDLRRAYSIDAVLIEINYALGPAAIASMLVVTSATNAFALAICVLVAGLLVFAASPALSYFRATRHEQRHLLGPLAEPGLLLVFVATFGIGVAFGCLEVGYPGYATARSTPALGGLLLTICSAGSAIAGIVFGGLALRAPIERQFAIATGLMVPPLFLHAWVEAPLAFAAVAFLAGVSIAPSIACQSVLITRLAPARYATEAFTWSSTCIMTGVGAGMALGGWLIETRGVKVAFAFAAAAMLAVALAALAVPRLSLAKSGAPG